MLVSERTTLFQLSTGPVSVPKMVGKQCEREYNAFMCSRECYTLSLGNLIAGLLVFLAAFLVGVALVNGIETLFLPDAQIYRLRNNLGPVSVQKLTPRHDVEPLAVVYDGMVSPVCEHLAFEERFKLTNVGSEPIYFELKDNQTLTAHISDAGGFYNLDVTFNVPVQRLNPGDSTFGSAWIPIDAKDYELSIDYLEGSRRVPRNSSLSSVDDNY